MAGEDAEDEVSFKSCCKDTSIQWLVLAVGASERKREEGEGKVEESRRMTGTLQWQGVIMLKAIESTRLPCPRDEKAQKQQGGSVRSKGKKRHKH